MAEEEKGKPEDEAQEEKTGDSENGEGGEGEEGLAPPKKKGLAAKKKLIIGVAAGFLLLGGAGAGLYFAGVFGEEKPADTSENAHHGAAESHGKEEEPQDKNATPVFFSLGDILVNLTGDGKRPNFLKIKISLELASEKDQKAIETLKPRIIDNFQVYLRELRVEDLRGSAGLYRLREELLLRVTEAVKPIRVKDVLFQEMLVQ